MNIKTVKQLKDMKQFKVKRVFTGKYHSENKDEFIQDYKNEIERVFGKDALKEVIVNDKNITFRDRFAFLPKMEKTNTGKIVVRSGGDYYFEYKDKESGEIKQSWGEVIKSDFLREYGFEVECMGGTIQYYILDEK